MGFELVYNTTDGPVTIDSDGRQLGGGEYGAADTSTPEVRDAVARGNLINVEVGDETPSAEARRAVRRVAKLNEARDEVAKLPRDKLVERAVEAGLLAEEADPPLKERLVRALTYQTPFDDDDTLGGETGSGTFAATAKTEHVGATRGRRKEA